MRAVARLRRGRHAEAWGFPVAGFPGVVRRGTGGGGAPRRIDVFWIVGELSRHAAASRSGRGRPSARSAPASTTTSCSRTRCSSSRATSSCSFPRRRGTRSPGAEPRRPRSVAIIFSPRSPGRGSARRVRNGSLRRGGAAGAAGARGKSPNRVVRPVARGDLAGRSSLRRHRKAAEERRLDAMGRTAPVRERRVRDRRGRPVSQRRSCPDRTAPPERSRYPPAAENSSTRWCSARRTL